jgi:hypothetical protein
MTAIRRPEPDGKGAFLQRDDGNGGQWWFHDESTVRQFRGRVWSIDANVFDDRRTLDVVWVWRSEFGWYGLEWRATRNLAGCGNDEAVCLPLANDLVIYNIAGPCAFL